MLSSHAYISLLNSRQEVSSSDDDDDDLSSESSFDFDDAKPLINRAQQPKEIETCTIVESDPFVEMDNLNRSFESTNGGGGGGAIGPSTSMTANRTTASSQHADTLLGHSSSGGVVRNFVDNTTILNRELVTLRKQLMQKEFIELQQMRQQKHRFEMEILRAELEMKKVEHRRRVALYDKQLQS